MDDMQAKPYSLVVSAQWMAENLNHPDVTVVDCRFSLAEPALGASQYRQGHIPGAYYLDLNLDLSSPVQRHGGRHPLPNPSILGEKLAAMGIDSTDSRASLVVAYDDSRFAFGARLWWLLRYLGHDRVALLDGGWSRWQAAGYPVSDAIPEAKSGNFSVRLQSEQVVDIETVKTRKDLPGVSLVDSRDRDRYLGLHEPIDPIAGHIPGATNYPWKAVTDDAGQAQSAEELRSRWDDLADAEEIVVYCGSGVTACVNLWSLERAGIHTGKLYAGSWSDWCSYQLKD